MNIQTGTKTIRYIDYTTIGLKNKKSKQNIKATIGDRIQFRLNSGADYFGDIVKITDNYITISNMEYYNTDNFPVHIKDIAEYVVTVQGQLGNFINQAQK